MIDCKWKVDDIDSRKKTCVNCGRVILSKNSIDRLKANCTINRENDNSINLVNIQYGDVKSHDKIKPKERTLVETGLGFLKDTSKFILNGLPVLNDEDYTKRLEICNSCEFRKNHTCSICSCYLPIKARWKTTECPEKKWPGDSQTKPIE